jgi:hypothetical protein
VILHTTFARILRLPPDTASASDQQALTARFTHLTQHISDSLCGLQATLQEASRIMSQLLIIEKKNVLVSIASRWLLTSATVIDCINTRQLMTDH